VAVTLGKKCERALERTDPLDPHALERDADELVRVLVRTWGDDAPRVAARVLELAREAVSDPAAYRAAVSRRSHPRPRGEKKPPAHAPRSADSRAAAGVLGDDRGPGQGGARAGRQSELWEAKR